MLGNLKDYDVAELLLMLADAGRSGIFEVRTPKSVFRLSLARGLVSDVVYGIAREDAALALLLAEAQGQFVFTPKAVPPPTTAQRSARAALLAALRLLPPPALLFDGPAKVLEHLDPDALQLTPMERRAVDKVKAGQAVGDFADDPDAAASVARFARLGLIAPRKVRVARLTLGVWRGGGPEVALDAAIADAWAQQLGRFSGRVQIRTDAGNTVTFAARRTPGLGPKLLLSPETLMLHGMRAGDSVLAKPAE